MLGSGEHGHRIGPVRDDGGQPDLVRPPPGEGEGHIGEWQVLVTGKRGGQRALASGSDSAVRADSSSTCGPADAGATAAGAGASSTTTWALVPPTPKELTPARRGSTDSHGR